MKCGLCQKEKPLLDSHIIPAFVFKWIKNTSATGYLRFLENINLRAQDGKKTKLLCSDCENILSVVETKFANAIFYPYVDYELDQNGVAKGKIRFFDYDDWLLRFIISIHWRLTVVRDAASKRIPIGYEKLIKKFEEQWRNLLLDETKDTGLCESHLIFLQNLATAEGCFPPNLHEKVNFYCLRATDGTIIFSDRVLGVFSKIGPIAFYTFIKPHHLKRATDTKVRMKGKMITAQKIGNPNLVEFLLIHRPNEVMDSVSYSENQKQIIENAIKKNPGKASDSLTASALLGDLIIRKKKLDRQ